MVSANHGIHGVRDYCARGDGATLDMAALQQAIDTCATAGGGTVTVTNCVFSTPCNALRIGVGDGVVRDCTLSNIVVKESRTGLSIVSCYSERQQHGARLQNLHFSNFVMDTMMPVNMLLGPHAKPPALIRNLSFSHFYLLARQGCYFGGNPGHRIEDLRLHEIDLRLTEGDVSPGSRATQAHPGGGTRGIPSGLLVSEVDGLRVSGLRVRWEDVTATGSTG